MTYAQAKIKLQQAIDEVILTKITLQNADNNVAHARLQLKKASPSQVPLMSLVDPRELGIQGLPEISPAPDVDPKLALALKKAEQELSVAKANMTKAIKNVKKQEINVKNAFEQECFLKINHGVAFIDELDKSEGLVSPVGKSLKATTDRILKAKYTEQLDSLTEVFERLATLGMRYQTDVLNIDQCLSDFNTAIGLMVSDDTMGAGIKKATEAAETFKKNATRLNQKFTNEQVKCLNELKALLITRNEKVAEIQKIYKNSETSLYTESDVKLAKDIGEVINDIDGQINTVKAQFLNYEAGKLKIKELQTKIQQTKDIFTSKDFALVESESQYQKNIREIVSIVTDNPVLEKSPRMMQINNFQLKQSIESMMALNLVRSAEVQSVSDRTTNVALDVTTFAMENLFFGTIGYVPGVTSDILKATDIISLTKTVGTVIAEEARVILQSDGPFSLGTRIKREAIKQWDRMQSNIKDNKLVVGAAVTAEAALAITLLILFPPAAAIAYLALTGNALPLKTLLMTIYTETQKDKEVNETMQKQLEELITVTNFVESMQHHTQEPNPATQLKMLLNNSEFDQLLKPEDMAPYEILNPETSAFVDDPANSFAMLEKLLGQRQQQSTHSRILSMLTASPAPKTAPEVTPEAPLVKSTGSASPQITEVSSSKPTQILSEEQQQESIPTSVIKP